MTKKYTGPWSRVDIELTDGTVLPFFMTAGTTIASYLMREAAHTGVLTVRNDHDNFALCVPMPRVAAVTFHGAKAPMEPQNVVEGLPVAIEGIVA